MIIKVKESHKIFGSVDTVCYIVIWLKQDADNQDNKSWSKITDIYLYKTLRLCKILYLWTSELGTQV